jgi:hypothetical protein
MFLPNFLLPPLLHIATLKLIPKPSAYDIPLGKCPSLLIFFISLIGFVYIIYIRIFSKDTTVAPP